MMSILAGMSMGWTMAGFAMGIMASIIGYFARSVTRQGLVFRCPIWIGTVVAEVLLVILGVFYPVLLSVPVQTAMICLIMGYPVGYTMANPGDNVAIDLIDEYNNSDAALIFFYHHNGSKYLMPQTTMGCIKSLLGARYPLVMDLQFARRTRSHATANRYWSVKVDAYVAHSHIISEDSTGILRYWTTRRILDDGAIAELPRYLFRPKIEIHEVYFAESAVEDPNSFLVKTDTYHEALAMAAREKGKSTRVSVEANNAAYTSAAKILQEMFALDVDGPQVSEDLRTRLEAIKIRKGGEIDATVLSADSAESDVISG